MGELSGAGLQDAATMTVRDLRGKHKPGAAGKKDLQSAVDNIVNHALSAKDSLARITGFVQQA
jgi:hypothetical protein